MGAPVGSEPPLQRRPRPALSARPEQRSLALEAVQPGLWSQTAAQEQGDLGQLLNLSESLFAPL